jgi:hypothetical protein
VNFHADSESGAKTHVFAYQNGDNGVQFIIFKFLIGNELQRFHRYNVFENINSVFDTVFGISVKIYLEKPSSYVSLLLFSAKTSTMRQNTEYRIL